MREKNLVETAESVRHLLHQQFRVEERLEIKLYGLLYHLSTSEWRETDKIYRDRYGISIGKAMYRECVHVDFVLLILWRQRMNSLTRFQRWIITKLVKPLL